GVQIAICAVLVTASLVAVRGLARSLESRLGFEPNHVLLADTDLSMAGYTGDQVAVVQKRMIEAVAAIPDVTSVRILRRPPVSLSWLGSRVYTGRTTDLRRSTAVAPADRYQFSPESFAAAGTALLAGRAFSWHDDREAPRVAVMNRELARRFASSPADAIGV